MFKEHERYIDSAGNLKYSESDLQRMPGTNLQLMNKALQDRRFALCAVDYDPQCQQELQRVEQALQTVRTVMQAKHMPC